MRVSISTHWFRALLVFGIGLIAVSIMPLLSKAQPATSLNIVNNSGRSIEHVYFSHVNTDDWSSNQLESRISAGQSGSVSNFTCETEQMRAIVEDGEGCFSYQVISCGTSSTWTVNNDTERDCGSGGW